MSQTKLNPWEHSNQGHGGAYKGIQGYSVYKGSQAYPGVFKGTSIRCDHNQNPAVCKVTKINYNEKTAKKKRRASWFCRYFGQSSRPSSGD